MWRRQARLNQRGHYEMEERCAGRAFVFGVASAALSAGVGVLILLAVRSDPPVWLRLLTAGVSIMASAITAVATSSKWSEKAAQHHATAAEYGKIRRKMEEMLVLPSEQEDVIRKSLSLIRERMDELPPSSPAIPKSVWSTISKELTPFSTSKDFHVNQPPPEITRGK